MASTKREKAGQYHHGDLRRALIDAASRAVGESGADAVTLRGVAREAGVSHAALYRHFPDKNALLAALAQEGFIALGKAVAAAASRAQGGRERLIAAAEGYVEFARKRPAYFAVMFHSGPSSDEAVVDASALAFQGLVRLIEDAQAEGSLPSEGSEDMARAAWSLVHGMAELATSRRLGVLGRKKLAKLVHMAASALVAGLADAELR